MEYICHFAIYITTIIIFYHLLVKIFLLALENQIHDHNEAFAIMHHTLIQTIADYWTIKFATTPSVEQKAACVFAVGNGTRYINQMMGADSPSYTTADTAPEPKPPVTDPELPSNVIPLRTGTKSILPE